MNAPDSQPDVVVSEFADDAEMVELIELFVADLADRVEQIQAAFGASDNESLRSIAHQLKGAGGGYGFPTITDRAAAVERQVLAGPDDPESLSRAVKDLIELCKRVRA